MPSTTWHYQEHTQQQDGWTVLAPPPHSPEPADELPPLYTPDAPPAPAPAAAATGPTLNFEIPINSNVVGAALVTRTKHYGRGVWFSVAYVEICNVMGLDPSTASLGYKWDNEKANTVIHELSNATNWRDCIESGIGQTQQARTRKVVCMIKNLKLLEETVPSASAVAGTKKRKSASTSAADERKTFDFTKEHRALKAHLSCATHKGQFCYISPVDGHHELVKPYLLLLWAKEIVSCQSF
ncbi:hypothetical protein B0H10DRAFT_1955897 [Mycena sp. CBHHK59/15]|nr:hypothetical protein B0H10DRAFT_1955897 [Mycena sp. CBHHK59/15]